eukprot:gene8524-8706_t
MIWYLAFTGMFLLYQLDVMCLSLIALAARLVDALYPPPGHPAYWWWHKDRVVHPAECDARGYRIGAGPESLADLLGYKSDGGKADTHALSVQNLSSIAFSKASTWQISTTAAPPGSTCSSSFGVQSEYASSVASESHPATPQHLQGPATQTAFEPAPLQTVYSLPRVDQADHPFSVYNLVMPQHRQESSKGPVKDGAIPVTGPAGLSIRPVVTESSDAPSSGLPPQCSAVLGADDGYLLPASLVDQYGYFPLVLVQLPMYNEEAHCEVVIERACNIIWPRHRVVIQVCDDSTRNRVKQRINTKVVEMQERGFNCLVTRRDVNVGFKAGNMINGMQCLTELPWEYVAVFDADFEMPADFLYQTIYHMQRDRKLAFVQTRWCFTNAYDNLLCWCQAVCLNYHFAVEQRARSFLQTFFGFNGTAGIWRRTAMEQAGGWNMDSTVEDMDLSLRAYLNGWKFKYLHWVSCPNELPPTMSAYKTQQYRWNSGPMVVVKQLIRRIWTTTAVTLLDRISCSYFFFRFIYSAFLTIICLLCPAVVVWLDPWQWGWAPTLFLVSGNMTALSFIWFAGVLFWPYCLLQTGVGYFRVFAMINGLLGSKKSGTWKVTKKFGKGGAVTRTYHKPYMLELLLAVLFFGYATAAVWYGVYLLAGFCWVMAWTFVLISCGDYLF